MATTNNRRPAARRWACLLLAAIALTATNAATAPEGRWKLAGDGTCYLDLDDAGPDQCSGMPGRWKLGGDGSCHWDDDDAGPNQCMPLTPSSSSTRRAGTAPR